MGLYWGLILLTCVVFSSCEVHDFSDLPGDYCRTRRPRDCCPQRDDSCAVPILGTLCYCDNFCNRSVGLDCCPDFLPHCLGIRPRPKPEEIVRLGCHDRGRFYPYGQSIKRNCNKCTCRQISANVYDFVCDDNVCLIRPEMINAINNGNYGWRSSNYSFMWGKTLEEGIRYRLGTFKPTRSTLDMTEIHIPDQNIPESFDSRQKWPNLIQPIRDQGDCGSSWAFSTTSILSDRLAIQSRGKERITLSPQHLISCQHHGQRGCHGGHLDRAWWFLKKKGVATEACYPYESGITTETGKCKAKKWKNGNGTPVECPSGLVDILHHSTPPYRVSHTEKEIMEEIINNGPVQATFEVKEDFFLYRTGIYRHTPIAKHFPPKYKRSGWHSVRILGWGIDRSLGRPVKYWLCDNSWGRLWGEDGYFRIFRGDNECDIENFVIGVWARRHLLNGRSNTIRRVNET